MGCIPTLVASSRSLVASIGTLCRRNPSFRLLVPTLVLFIFITLCLFATNPVPDRSAIWLPSANVEGSTEYSVQEGYPPEERASINSAGNSTLGFGSIYFIYLANRYDRLDAMSLQSYLSGVDVTEYPAVGPGMIKDVGMPPTRKMGKLRTSEKGCWRAHANIWSTMLRQNLPPVLILESDATWDINIRKVMPNLNHHYRKFLKDINSTQLHNARWKESSQAGASHGNFEAPDDDPWLSRHWDVLFLGQCDETEENKDVNLIYNDPFVPAGKDYWGRALKHERVIRRSGGITCTTAYAISQTGAAKLLLRTAVSLDLPVDLVIQEMITSGDLISYSVMPPIVAQWQYAEGIGMEERGANSNIVRAGFFSGLFGFFTRKKAWENVDASGSVWTTKSRHKDVAFDEMTLQGAWKRVFGG